MKGFLKRGEKEHQAEEQRIREDERQRAEEAKLLETMAHFEAGNADAPAREMSKPVVVSSVYVPKSAPTVVGVKPRTLWSAKVVDFEKLIAHVAAHPEDSVYLLPNVVRLNEEARKLKSEFKLPGVAAVSETIP